MQRVPSRSYLWPWADNDIPHSAGQVRQLPSTDTGDTQGSGGRVRASCWDTVHQGVDAGAGRGGLQRHLQGALQQGEQIADAGLSAQGYDGMAGAVIGDLLSGGAYRLRAHQDPPKAECRYGSLLCGPGSEGGQDQGSTGDHQQAHGKRPGLGRDAE